jgi:hypothetical protein
MFKALPRNAYALKGSMEAAYIKYTIRSSADVRRQFCLLNRNFENLFFVFYKNVVTRKSSGLTLFEKEGGYHKRRRDFSICTANLKIPRLLCKLFL